MKAGSCECQSFSIAGNVALGYHILHGFHYSPPYLSGFGESRLCLLSQSKAVIAEAAFSVAQGVALRYNTSWLM
jgi:hypothetical protein